MDDSLLVTEPFARYLKECQDIIDFSATIWGTAAAFDKLAIEKYFPTFPEVSDIDEDAFAKAAEAHITEIINHQNPAKMAWLRLNEHRQLQCQMLHNRSVDNFLTYISELMAAVYHKQPNLLKTKDMVAIEDVLKYETKEEFVVALAEKRVQDLAYKGIRELAETLSKSWGVRLFANETVLPILAYTVEIRNIIAHNRGIVNQTFLKRTKGLDLGIELPTALGDPLLLDIDVVVTYLKFTLSSTFEIDKIVTAKFALPTQPAPEPKDSFDFPFDVEASAEKM